MITIKKGILMFLCLIILLLNSCQKEELLIASLEKEGQPGPSISDVCDDEMGKKLEFALSAAIEDKNFKSVLVTMTQELRTGDYEVLLTDLLDVQLEGRATTQSILLDKAKGLFDESDLEVSWEIGESNVVYNDDGTFNLHLHRSDSIEHQDGIVVVGSIDMDEGELTT